MDEVFNSGSHQPSSPVMESPLMQLANASMMRASLSPKRKLKNSEVESKSNRFFPVLHSTSSNASMDPNISHSSNSTIDTTTQTQIPLESTVSIMSNPSSDKLIKPSFIFVGTENPVLETVTAPHIPKHENVFSPVTVANVDIITPESHSHKEHTQYLLPHDDSIYAKSSVSRVLTSNPSESVFTTSDISTVAAGDAISKMTVDPKDVVSSQTSSHFPMLPRLALPPSQMNTTNPQAENISSKTSSTVKVIPENEKNISFMPSESTLKTNCTAMQSVQSVSLTQRNAKVFANHSPVSVCSVTQSQNGANISPQIKYLSNTKCTSVSNTCSLPTKIPFVLPVTASSNPTAVALHSNPLLQLHTVTQSSKNHCLLNKPSYMRESQNISKNVTTTKETISSSTSVSVPTLHPSSVTLNHNFSQIPFPAKSSNYISPYTTTVGTGINDEKINSSNTSYSSVNPVSETSSFISKQLNNTDEKDIALCSSSRRAVQAKVNVEVPSKPFSPLTSTKDAHCSSEESNTSLAKNYNTDLVCRVDSVVFCTPTINTTTSPTTKCSPNRVTSTLSTSMTCSTTLSISAASDKLCTLSVSACAPVIAPQIGTGSQTVATLTPSLPSSSVLSDASYLSSLTTAAATTTTTNTYCSVSCASSSFIYTPSIATSTLIITPLTTTSTSAVASCIPSATVQSPKELMLLQEYESITNKFGVNDSKNIAKRPLYTGFQGGNLPINATKSHTGMAHFIEGELSNVQSTVIQKQHSSTLAMEPLLKIANDETENKLQVVNFIDEPYSAIDETEASSTIAKSEASSTIAETGACPPVAETGACPPVAETGVCPPVAETEACPPVAETEACPPVAETEACPPVAETEACPPVAKTEGCPPVAETEACPPVAETEACPPVAETEACPPVAETEACPPVAKTEACPPVAKTEVCPPTAKTGVGSTAAETKTHSSMVTGSEACSTIAGIESLSPIGKSEILSSNLNQFVSSGSDEAYVTAINTSDEKTIECKSPIDEVLKNSSSKIETNIYSSVKQSALNTITKSYVISNITSDCMNKTSSYDKSIPFSDQKSATLVDTFESVNDDDIKKNLVTNKNTSKSSLVSHVSELVPLPTKKSKRLKKDSKSHTVSKMRVPSNSTSVCDKEEAAAVSSDFSYPKSSSLLKDNLTISSNEKNKSLLLSLNAETDVTIKGGNALIKTEECNISTRPRRTIKARHLFSSSSYSTGYTKSDTSGESLSSKQRKRINTPSTTEEKKGKSNIATKKVSTSKTTDEETDSSPLKTLVRRRILPAIKTDSTVAPKKCLIESSNIAQVPSDNLIPLGCTYLLTALNLTNAENDFVKKVKTPTMASDSGVTSTSPTYSNSKRNVTTKCSSTKEQQSTKLTFVETNKACSNPLISSSKTSVSHKTGNISPVNYPSEESLEDTNQSDTLQNSIKMPSSTCDISAASNSLSPRSCDDFSQQIAEAETFIKKEPLEITEADELIIENNAVVTSQNSSAECTSTRETHTISTLLNSGCSNTQVSVQDFISPTSGNTVSQTMPLAPVQLSSPYAIFLPVSLASGATTTATTPSTSAPLYSIQLNVPNVVRMGKPFLPNDGGITKKHCTIIPTITCPKTSVKSNLISRNSLIATYYPAPLPESLMNKITVNYHACGECGDTFLFKSSLNTHKTRKCMQLTYNCDNCTMKLVFYNKCSVLEHIRSHYPTRPVTIKLERMEVMPLPESITDVLETEDESNEESSLSNSEEATAKFDCIECGSKFHSARALADHFGHSEIVCSFTFYCALCQTYLPRHCAQLAHRRVHHEKPPHVCPECGQLISNIFSFREHLKYKCMHFSRIAPLTCPKCISKFCYTPELKEHIISVHSETFIKCSICPMAFKTFPSYQTHAQNAHASELEQKKEIYKCPLCDTVFHTMQQLMNHVDIHIGELKKGISYAFRCSMCSAIFAKRSQLVSHLSSSHHLDYMQHRCEFCDCVCKTAHNLHTHQKAIHKGELKTVEFSKSNKIKKELTTAKSKKKKNKDVTHCSFCHIFFATLAQLQMHTMKVHQKKMKDSLPDSGTVLEKSLSSTQVPKNKNSQKVCRYCKAPYKSWSRLMQHILGHRKSGVYICLICTSAAFLNKEEFNKHEELCSGETPLHDKPSSVYECEECHQLFKQESWLIAHQKNIHPKKEAFTCDSCGLHYKSNSSLQKHMQTVHEGKMVFCCYYCKELNMEKTFQCENQLEKHLMIKHSMSLNQMKMKQSDDEEEVNKTGHISEETSSTNSQATVKSLDVVPAKKAKLSTTKEETYICEKCNFTSKKLEIFQLHIQVHKTSDDGIQCRICGLCFAAVDSLRMHLFAVHKMKCCNDTFQDNGVNKSPVSKELEDSSLCTVSQPPASNTILTVVNSESTTTVPVESVSKEEELVKPTSDTNSEMNLISCQCNVCLKMFETEHQLKVHMRTHGMAFIRSKYLTMSDLSSS